jgi:hypothetical protein
MKQEREQMTTVKQLIEQLEEIEDKEQTVIYQYYLAEHFWMDDEQPTPAEFETVAKDGETKYIWDGAGEHINDKLAAIVYNRKGNK